MTGYYTSSVKIMTKYRKKDFFSFNHILFSYNLPFIYGTVTSADFPFINTQMLRPS